MSVDERDQRFIETARSMLDRSADELDPPTALRLQRARVEALRARPRPARWIFAGGVATAAMAMFAAIVWFSEPAPVIPLHEVDELDVVTAADHLEFYEEIEFYRWLAEHPGEG